MASRRGILVVAAVALALAGVGLWYARSARVTGPLERGRDAYGRGDWRGAAALARARLRERPGDREALRLLARSSARLGQDDSARRIFARLGGDAMQPDDLLLIAAGLERQGEALQAAQVLVQVLEADPDRPEALEDLSRLSASADRLDAAAALAERLAERPGWEVRGALLLGRTRHELSDPAAAVAALSRALRIDPTLKGAAQRPSEVRKLLARDLLRTGRRAEARDQVRAVLASGPDPEASWLLSRALLQSGEVRSAASALAEAKGFGASDTTAPEPAPFVGSARCAGCHRPIYRRQQSGGHAHTYHKTEDLPALPLPDGPVEDSGDPRVSHAIRREGGRVRWETRAGAKVQRALVDYAFGSGARAVTLVGHEDSGLARELRLTHYHQSGWDLTTGSFKLPSDPDDFLGKPFEVDDIRRCFECHTTDVHAARAGIEPLASERGIGCERCHGPGGHHVLAVSSGGEFPDLAIGRPGAASAAQSVALCANCHSPRVRKISLSDLDAVRFQGTTLTWSRCYTESRGGMRCTTCHDPHADAETSPSYYESRCLACHSPTSDDPAGGHPCPVNPSDGCIKCHMPGDPDAVPHVTFTDHFIRVHPERGRRD